jgi:hypothetical protein
MLDSLDLEGARALLAGLTPSNWLALLVQTGAVGLLLVTARLAGRGLLWATRRPVAWFLSVPADLAVRVWRLAFPGRSPACRALLAVLDDPEATYDPAAGKLLAGKGAGQLLVMLHTASGARQVTENRPGGGEVSYTVAWNQWDIISAVVGPESVPVTEPTLGKVEWELFSWRVRQVVARLERRRLADLEREQLLALEAVRRRLVEAMAVPAPPAAGGTSRQAKMVTFNLDPPAAPR